MTSGAVAEYAVAVQSRYRAAGRSEKKRILDEFCETTGMHRKAVIRLLNREVGPRKGPGGRPRRYGAEVSAALVTVWEAGDRMCGKLLAAVMEDLVSALERHGELHASADVRSLLLAISPASIDRLLRRHRRLLSMQPQRKQPAAGGLKSEIPVRTWSDWEGAPVGSLQGDLVLHCGESTGGFYLSSLCTVDVATGWVELQPVWGTGAQRVGTAVHLIRQKLPFALQSLHTDNGAEFLNHTLFSWCRKEGVAFSRGRSYRKNDQAYVEQRNWQAVRRQVGYDRLASKRAYALLGELHPLLSLQLNFLRPIRKLAAKERIGPRVIKRYDTPRTPYQRVLASGVLGEEKRGELQTRLVGINPMALRRRIDGLVRQLWALGEREPTTAAVAE